MAVNQGKIMEGLETAVSGAGDEFIYRFLELYDFPRATVTQLRKGTGNRNVADEPGAVALRNKLYFLPVPAGQSVSAAFDALLASGRIERHSMRFVFVTDFDTVMAFDRAMDDRVEFGFQEIPRQYSFFLPLAGQERVQMHTEAVADVKAADRMGRFCDLLRDRNPLDTPEDIHGLNVFLTRILFCLFAEDTGIFEKHQFTEAFLSHTAEDGSNAHLFLRELFQVLNEPERPGDRPAHLAAFPYVNGGLFEQDLPVPKMAGRARRLLRDAGKLDWSEINPDIFGSMFQSVIDPEQRGSLGQHYTSPSNIMKVLRPLFLDGLHEDLKKAEGSPKKLNRLLERLHSLKVFDPAAGSGNFLITAYKELRRLEMAVFKALDRADTPEPLIPEPQDEMFDKPGQQPLMAPASQRNIYMSGIRLEQFYGIEIDDFAHEIALLSLWLAEHQMNLEFREEFGYAEPALPLKSSGSIALGDSLHLNWKKVCPVDSGAEVYVCGNPPFLGANGRSDEQNASMELVFSGFRKYRYLDFVASWFWKGAQYIRGTEAQCAFVSTNSICQGEQVAMLWPYILDLGVKIRFAYQTFAWKNSARGNAGVHVIVVGLTDGGASLARGDRTIYKFTEGEWRYQRVKNISPYLLEGTDTVVKSRSNPLVASSPMVYGNKPVDGGHLMLTTQEKDELIAAEPQAAKWIKRLLGADEFLKGKDRWCLWLVGATEQDIDAMPLVRGRVEKVREKRLQSRDAGARQLAENPHEFRDTNNPKQYILVPRHTSERREYAPVGFFGSDVIAADSVQIIPDSTTYDFAILSTQMHMDWLRLVGGRLKSDYRYSGKLVYNTFPWPPATDRQRSEIEALGEEVLLAREETFEWTMAEMYDPDKMPDALRKAHRELDEAVERLYRAKPFRDQAERQEYLLARYEQLIQQEQGAANA
ncbi:DNA methyltransferase [Thioalkalivibrio sp. ALE16]|uniref:DNA methyltransferase n=1 Tax=Thioalkalivibrio sp. ALE16 TaxID=1158172 RepID=UPI0004755C0B|nr:DNA methyltransferase [Thioalkalivibrio sp. ALE16]